MATIHIKLEVNTEKLKSIAYKKGITDLNDYCTFSGQAAGSNVELFTTNVDLGDEIEWEGVTTSNNSDIVEIFNITRQSGKKFLKLGKDLKPGSGGNTKKKKCDVKKKGYRNNNWEKYNLFFRINSVEPTYEIDPIINIHRRT